MTKLPPDLQKRLGYDADKAKRAADSRSQEDVENAKELQAEMDEAQRMTEARLAQEQADTDAATARNSGRGSGAAAAGGQSHYTLEDLNASVHTLRDTSGATHYSISDVSIHTLQPAPDTTHHTIDEIASGGL